MRRTLVTLFAIASLGALLGLTVILGSILGREMTLRMNELKSRSIQELESVLGSKVTYASISPSFLNYLEIRDLTIHDPTESGKPLLTIHRVRIYYSLAHLLARGDPVGSLREIRILNTRLSLDLQEDATIVNLIQRLTEKGASDTGLRARITGEDVNLALHNRGTTLTVSHLFFGLSAEKGALAATFRGDCSATLPSGFSFSSQLNVSGKIDRTFTWSDLTVRLLSFDSSLFHVERQTLQVVWKGNTVQVQKIEDRSPIELGITADLDTKLLTLNFQTDGLRADRLVRFSGGMAKFNSLLKAPVTATGRVTYAVPSNSLSYEVGISAWFEDELPVHDLTLESTFVGTEKGASFSPLRLSSPTGSLQFDGNVSYRDFYPEGIVTLTDVETGTGKSVSAELTVQRRNGGLAVEGRHLKFGEVGFDNVSILLAPAERGARFTFESSLAGSKNGRISAQGELLLRRPLRAALAAADQEPATFPGIVLTASLRDVPPNKLYDLFVGAGPVSKQREDLRGALSRYAVTADVQLTSDFSTVTARSQGVTVAQIDDPTTHMRFSLALDSSHISVDDFSGEWHGHTVSGSLLAGFSEDRQVSFSSYLTVLGTPFSFSGRYSQAAGLFATGSYDSELSIVPNRDGTYSLLARAERLPVPLGDSTTMVSFDATGLYSKPGEWALRAPAFLVFNAPIPGSPQNAISFSARITPKKVELDNLTFKDAYSNLAGSALATLVVPKDPFDPQFLTQLVATFSGSLKGRAGGESYAAQGTLKGRTIAVTMTFNGVPLERMRSQSIRGELSGTGTIAGPLDQPSVTLHVSLKDGRLGTDPIAMETDAALGPDTVQLSSMKVAYLAHNLSDGAGIVDLRKGTFSLGVRYSGEYFSERVKLTARLDGQFNTRPQSTLASNLLDLGLQGRLSLSDITSDGKAFPGWDVVFRTEGARLILDGGPGNSIHGSVDSHLAFAIHLARPLPFVGDAGGRIIGDNIVASAAIETFDATVLNSVLKTAPVTTQAGTFPVISFTSGTAAGHLSLSGPVNDPDFNGELAVMGARVTCAYSPDDAGPILTRLIFAGKEFHFPRVLVSAGESHLSAEASFTIDHWAPTAFDLTLRTEDETSTHLRAKFGRMIADGHVQGTMRIAGNDATTNVTGDILVTDCRITLGQASTAAFVPEEPPTFVTLSAETGKRVEFAWPSESYPVLRTTASPGGKLAFTYRGDTGAYTVKGTAAVQGGEIYYFERSFILRKGAISFNETQQSFDPHISARAEVREWDSSTGEEVRIYLDADNPLSKFTPRFSSDPPRSENYLLAMIGAPFVARAETQGLGMSAALISTDIVSQAWLLRPLESRLRDVLGLDMVSVRTQVIQNLLAQRIFGTSLNPLDNTSISLGKYVGNDLFLEALVKLQTQPIPGSTGFSPYASGASGVGLPPIPVATLPTAGIGIQPQLEWSMEWTTPFFTLDWIWQPQHPETLFLTDNALAFSWRFSY